MGEGGIHKIVKRGGGGWHGGSRKRHKGGWAVIHFYGGQKMNSSMGKFARV